VCVCFLRLGDSFVEPAADLVFADDDRSIFEDERRDRI